MRVVVLGGSGFIGSSLIKTLEGRDHSIIVSTRDSSDISISPSSNVSYVVWNGIDREPCFKMFDGADVIINLIGENIASK